MSEATQPLLETPRLLLRPFTLSDASEVQRLAGAWEIADKTLNVPHPYADGMAEAWIGGHAARFAEGEAATFAIAARDEGRLLGCIGLVMALPHRRADLGYWLGIPFWNQGYMTEAARAVVGYVFGTLSLHKITASHLARNPASGRVMEKVGMTREGVLRQHAVKNGRLEDLVVYGLLSSDWQTELRPPL